MQGRDPASVFEILVREHSDMLVAYLRAVVRDRAAVEDLFQETMMVAWRRLDDFDRSRPFGPWLRGIASKLVLAHGRKTRRRGLVCNEVVLIRLDEQMDRLSQRRGDTFDEKISALRDCVGRLDEPYAEAVRLRYLEGRGAAHIAAQLEISREALKKRLQRARARLLDCLERNHVVSGASA